MNEWAERTVRLVTEEDYLDRLQAIYPNEDIQRKVSEETIDSIRQAYAAHDNVVLLNRLLDLEKFPYKDSYVGFLRRDREAIGRNPQTVQRICNRLYEMGLEGIIAGASLPKEANTRRGNQFHAWLRGQFKQIGITEFRRSTQDIAILDATERDARDFCNAEMGVGISKRPDMVAKSGSKYVIGEAKFLSSTGGNQGRAFDDGMTLATNDSGSAYKVFILDGIHWIEKGSGQFKRIEYCTSAVLSALLLRNFLESVPQ